MKILYTIFILSLNTVSCSKYDIYTNTRYIESGNGKVIVMPYHKDSITVELVGNHKDFS